MRKMLWIGSYVDTATEDYLKQTIAYKKPSTSLSQRNILEGLEQVSGQYFDCIGAVVLHGFPKDKKLWVPSVTFERPGGKTGCLAGFLNIMYLNKPLTACRLKSQVRKWIRQNRQCDGVDVFVYEARSACMQAAALVKKHIPNTRIHLIVPDLPCFMDLHMSPLKRKLKQWDWRRICRSLADMDDFILYTQTMAQRLGIQDRPWLRMEGSIRVQPDSPVSDVAPADTCVVMYSGSINARFGILNLVEAMKLLGSGYALWITGMGPDAELVKSAAAQTENVRFYGFLPSQQAVMDMQAQATALINMRDPGEEASAYCFPSKLFEYMLTGRPVLSCRLGGIPEEYFEYLIEMQDISPEGIAESVRRLAAMTPQQRQNAGTKGREFVLQQKNHLAQAERIWTFIQAQPE